MLCTNGWTSMNVLRILFSENYDYYDYALALFFLDFVSKHMLFFLVFQDWIDRDFCFPKIMIMRCYCFLWYEELIIPPRCCFSGKLLCDFVFFSNVLKYWIIEYNTEFQNHSKVAEFMENYVFLFSESYDYEMALFSRERKVYKKSRHAKKNTEIRFF